jgi:hypothetical protein
MTTSESFIFISLVFGKTRDTQTVGRDTMVLQRAFWGNLISPDF